MIVRNPGKRQDGRDPRPNVSTAAHLNSSRYFGFFTNPVPQYGRFFPLASWRAIFFLDQEVLEHPLLLFHGTFAQS